MGNKLAILSWGAAEVSLGAGDVTIGRATGNDVVLDDALVSRHHARIETRENQTSIVDLRSQTGTYVNGQRVRTSLLSDGDVIYLGTTVARFVSARRTHSLLEKPSQLLMAWITD